MRLQGGGTEQQRLLCEPRHELWAFAEDELDSVLDLRRVTVDLFFEDSCASLPCCPKRWREEFRVIANDTEAMIPVVTADETEVPKFGIRQVRLKLRSGWLRNGTLKS